MSKGCKDLQEKYQISSILIKGNTNRRCQNSLNMHFICIIVITILPQKGMMCINNFVRALCSVNSCNLAIEFVELGAEEKRSWARKGRREGFSWIRELCGGSLGLGYRRPPWYSEPHLLRESIDEFNRL